VLILGILCGGGVATLIVALLVMALARNGRGAVAAGENAASAMNRDTWRMPPLDSLPPMRLSLAAKTWMGTLRFYLVVAVCLVAFRIAMVALGNG
jgi:hypothetical protein